MLRYGSLLLVIALLFTAACASSQKNSSVREEVAGQFVEATPFKTMAEETSGDVLTGIGTSEKRANYSLMREAAITSAQADLARKVDSKVEAVWKRTMADWTEYKIKGKDEAMSVEEVKTMQKTIVDTEIKGPWQSQEVIDKETGRYWVRVLLSTATVEKWTLQRMNSENLLKKYIIETQIKKVQEDLQKDLDAVKAKESAENEKIKDLIR